MYYSERHLKIKTPALILNKATARYTHKNSIKDKEHKRCFLQPTQSFPLIHSVLLHCGRSRTALHPSTRHQPRVVQTQAEWWHPAVNVRQRVCVRAQTQWCGEAQALPVTCTCTTRKKKKKTRIKAASQSLSQCPLEGLVSLQQLSSLTHSKWLMRIKLRVLWLNASDFARHRSEAPHLFIYLFLKLTNIEGELWTSCNVTEVK